MCWLKEGYGVEPISRHLASCLFAVVLFFCVLQRRTSLKERSWSVLQCFTVLTSDFTSSVCVCPVHSKYKKDRRPSPTCECADAKQDGG
jgi:hypothetical protein